MPNRPASIFFDKNDYELLRIVNEVLDREAESLSMRSLLNEHMHPQGIKEMAASRGLRIAYAIASLLGSFEIGTPNNRIRALRSLRDEVLIPTTSFYQKNIARVLVQIMKDLLRSKGDELRQLKLAHDFRMVSTGNPRKVRAELARYHLLEMPEEWNQFAFDDHVHDANTKGRKSPTHLLMDAWIKGIRYLTVIYYNHVRPSVVKELVESAAILDIRVQVGIEMSSRFRDKYVRITWEPHGFSNNDSFLKFLEDDATIDLMKEGRRVSQYQQQYVFDVLEVFNTRHRLELGDKLGINLDPLDHDAFITFVGVGQPSLLHLASFIHTTITTTIRNQAADSDTGDNLWKAVERLSIESIINEYLLPSKNPSLHDPTRPQDTDDLPPLLALTPDTLLSRLLSLHSSSRFSLNLSNLTIQDTLELLYICRGMISHVETYNLTNAAHGTSFMAPRHTTAGEAVDLKSPEQNYRLINELQKALNEDNVIILKRIIRSIIWDHEEQYLRLKKYLEFVPEEKDDKEHIRQELAGMIKRKEDLMDILFHLETFHQYYQKRTLRSRIGSGSTGLAGYRQGMGLAVLDTLPARAQHCVQQALAKQKRRIIPVSAILTRNVHKRRNKDEYPGQASIFFWQRLTLLFKGFSESWCDWSLDGFVVHPGKQGNIATLGGVGRATTRRDVRRMGTVQGLGERWRYLNTDLKNSLKVLIGLIPAFFTFFLTKDWWLLAYFGAFIWFGITGSRNIIQSVLGGGGLRRSPLLPWNSLISWSRIADSLLYTGFSVPLLDFLVKTLLLDRGFGINTATNPIMLYAVMGLANGIYISSHNVLRGLPRGAAIGNLFRSILAIPIAILLNSIIGMFMALLGVGDVTGVLQKWAAIISKFASDCVAAVIEGLADRQTNVRARLKGYRAKISQLFYVFSRLDLQFPEEDVLDMLQSPKMMMQTLNYEARDQEKLIIVNALDLMYFWLYQPRAQKALNKLVETMSQEEWLIFYRSQLVLKRNKEISQVFVDGLVGRNFSKALAFYLDRSEKYLADLEKLGTKQKWHTRD